MNGNFPKRFGQVFLRDKNTATKEIKYLSIHDGDEILEVGPGDGILTDILLSYPVKLTAVEPDHRFYESLTIRHSELINSGKFSILKESFLDMHPSNYNHIIGNIPYNISSQILFHLLDFNFESAIMMVQKEFALRLVAKPYTKDYSRLTVNAGIRSNIKIIANVNRQVFSPVPGVDSSIIEIRKKSYDIDIKKFDAFLIKIFTMRRKKLSTILNYTGPLSEKRPGELSIDELLMVYSRI